MACTYLLGFGSPSSLVGSRINCSFDGGPGNQKRRTTLHHLYEKQGQSPWYDNIRRPVTDLIPLIASGIRGVTTNPAIYERAMLSSDAYHSQFRELLQAEKDVESAYWEMVVNDAQEACKLFQPIYADTDGEDGFVSIEVSPMLAYDTQRTTQEAKRLSEMVNCPNICIKIPATTESIISIKEVISQSISVNATVIFTLPTYEAVIDAYLDGLEASGLIDLSRVTSVASFYISRVDTLIDQKLEEIGTSQALKLRGKGAVAQATLAYKLFQKKFSGPRWEALMKRGAKKQKLLWASTNVKNPSYPDTSYTNPLIGPDTISTMPDEACCDLFSGVNKALKAFLHHGIVSKTIDANVSEAECTYHMLEELGIDWNAIGAQLELEVVGSFKKSFQNVLNSLQEKAQAL